MCKYKAINYNMLSKVTKLCEDLYMTCKKHANCLEISFIQHPGKIFTDHVTLSYLRKRALPTDCSKTDQPKEVPVSKLNSFKVKTGRIFLLLRD